ncbi:ATP-binding protein [Paenibacillus sp. CC-CFT742]|nr:AAA family ATPase [Paenibacillus sp. CC-CFT742]WJH27089.1 ATP-binding protein [Paenibacillus sp. CC-CFT742]
MFPTIIKRFYVKDLFGHTSFDIFFERNEKILVGENGLGKTTLLNILFNLISCNFEKLGDIEFERVILEFVSGKVVDIRHSELKQYYKNARIDLKKYLTNREWNELNRYRDIGRMSATRELVERIAARSEYSEGRIYKELRSFMMNEYDTIVNNNEEYAYYREVINNEFNCEVMYFPTYRRVEEDLHKLGIEDYNGKLIQFGMTDVEKAFKSITQDIKDSAIQWFSKVNGEMLSQLISGIDVTEDMINSIQRDALKIVLDRVGNNISDEYKERIDFLVKSGQLKNSAHEPLVYFLANLIKIYQQQREKDEAIQQFAEVCNKYLVGKKVEYNESSVEISIKQNGREIDISKLSSGEKQIVSLFSRIYLDSKQDFIIIFDEPELSLSIDWQSQLLPDILGSNRCKFMFVVTHSPFIFDNELDGAAKGLSVYITEDEDE